MPSAELWGFTPLKMPGNHGFDKGQETSQKIREYWEYLISAL